MAMTPEELQNLTDRVRLIRTLTRKQPLPLVKSEPKPEEKQAGIKAEDDLDREAERVAGLHYERLPPYYAQLPDSLLTTKRVSPEAKIVYALMHKHSAVKHLNKFPTLKISKQWLAEELDCSEETIRALINELVKEGWIGKYRQGRMLVNQYTLYPNSKKNWQTYVSMARVQLRIARDDGLRKRLQASIHHLSPYVTTEIPVVTPIEKAHE